MSIAHVLVTLLFLFVTGCARDPALVLTGTQCGQVPVSSCASFAGCKTLNCGACRAGDQPLVLCVDESDTGMSCPGIACIPCAGYADATTCAAVGGCHSIYDEQQAFMHCADGAKAKCAGTVLCRAQPPACTGDQVVGYTSDCFEGCVRSVDCE